MTADSAKKSGVPVAICGEMCVDPLSAVVLVGLGIDEFSCSPNMIPEVKKTIRSVTFDECKTLVKKILKLTTTEKIEKRVSAFLKERCPDLSVFAEGKQHGS
jgi:phosphotransferase system enzyme I (PtsI)